MDGATGFGAVKGAGGAGPAGGAVALCNAVYEGLVQGGAGDAAATLALHVSRGVWAALPALLDAGAAADVARWIESGTCWRTRCSTSRCWSALKAVLAAAG